VLLVLTARPAAAQNVLTNPHFDTSLTGWTSSGTVAFDAANDANGSPSSGSARVTALGITANTLTSAGPGQCQPAVAGTSYDYGGKVLVTAAPPNGFGFVILGFYASPTCTTFISSPGGAGNHITSINVWLQSGGTAIAPVGAQSMLIQTNEGTDASNPGDFTVNYDDMFLQVSGSVVPSMPPALIALMALSLLAGAVWMAKRNLGAGAGR
jgi:hypothetical protein